MKAIKVRIYPNNHQIGLLNNNFGSVRYIWNKALALKKNRYDNFGDDLGTFEISKMITFWKKTEELSWLKKADSQSLQQELRHLDSAYKKFFKGSGFPKFKKKSNKQSYSVVSNVSVVDNKIKLPKLGLLKCRGLRKFDKVIKTATISRNKANQYFVSFVIEEVIKIEKPKVIKKVIGIDVVIKDFAVMSDNTKIVNPNIIKKVEGKIKYYQRSLAKSKKGSSSFKRRRLKLARVWNNINNKKKDFLHKLSTDLVKNHDLICIEDLKVSNMLKNKRLAKLIGEVSWQEFRSMLEYKSEWYGTHLEVVDPKYTSQDCSTINCEFRNKELKLEDRSWVCPKCDTLHDRDINASINIKLKGIGSILKSGGDTSISLVSETRNS